MAFVLSNPYARYGSGKQRLDQLETDLFSEVGTVGSSDAAGTGRVIRPEFAPYASREWVPLFGAGEGIYADMMDLGRLNTDTDARVAADLARYDSMAGWDDPATQRIGDAPNYAGALAKALGMTPRAFETWAKASAPSAYSMDPSGVINYSINPFVGQRTALDALIAQNNLGDNSKVMDWRNSLEGALTSGGDAYVEKNNDKLTWGDALKAASFALLPAAIGPALTGTAGLGAANFGGGLAGDVLSGNALKTLRGGLTLGGSVLEDRGTPRISTTRPATAQPAAVDSQQTASLGDSVLSQDAPLSSSSGSLSNSVMSVSQPRNVVRRPQIRLTPGFRRGY